MSGSMKRIILIISLILVLLLSATVIYLNNVLLPNKIKLLIVEAIAEQTQNKVSLESVKLNIFKGLVLRNLSIYEGKEEIINIKEASCAFLIWPVFKKRIIIPALKIKYPVIYLERRADNTFNVQDLFAKKASPEPKTESTAAQAKGSGFELSIYWVRIVNGVVHFKDSFLPEPFTKDFENLNLNIYLSLPSRVKFNFKSKIHSIWQNSINAAGEYKIPENELNAKIYLQGIALKEFLPYYMNLGASTPEGLTNALASIKFKDDSIQGELEVDNANLSLQKEKITAQLNSMLKARFQYSFKEKQLGFSGKATLANSKIMGMESVGPVEAINGEIAFDNSGIYTEKLNAFIWGVLVESRASLVNFTDPLLNIHLFSTLRLDSLQRLLKEKLNFTLAGNMKGQGKLTLAILTKIPSADSLQISGYLDVFNGEFKLEKTLSTFDDIYGRIEFSSNQLRWSDLRFMFDKKLYASKCVITDFQSPGVQLWLSSDDLNLESILAVNKKLVKVSKLDGTYLNTQFAITGDVDISEENNLKTDLGGSLNLDLEDLRAFAGKFREKLDKAKPKGLVHCQFVLNGNPSDIKSCSIEAKVSGPKVYAYGLEARDFFLNYSQEEGKGDIPLVHFAMYDGSIDASASLDFKARAQPYWVSFDMKGVKIEKLKLDTPAKDKDISGTLQAQATLNGFSNDLEKLTGAGKIFITEGNLWQLNLFKGLGSLLFVKDFANIVFKEGDCSFILKDKVISTDELSLRSDIVNLTGPVKVGFNGSIDASFNVEVVSEMVPLTGSFRDVTTAIVGKAGRFGVIKIGGTLKEPNYKFTTSVVDILKGITNTIFNK